MVPQNAALCRPCTRPSDVWRDWILSQEIQKHLSPLAWKHQGLVYFTPIVVGTSHTRLLLYKYRWQARLCCCCHHWGSFGKGQNQEFYAYSQWPWAGEWLPWHMVLFMVMADFCFWWGQSSRQRGDQLLLSNIWPRNRAWHHFLLGGAYDYGRLWVSQDLSFQTCVLYGHCSWQVRSKDEQESRQFPRPYHAHREVWCRRRTHGYDAQCTCRQRHSLWRNALRTRS